MEVERHADKRKSAATNGSGAKMMRENGSANQPQPQLPPRRAQSMLPDSTSGYSSATSPTRPVRQRSDSDEDADLEHTKVQTRRKLASRGKTQLSRVKSVLMRQTASLRSLPKSIEAPVDVGDLAGVKQSDLFECIVILLDGARRDFRMHKKTGTGEDLMKKLAEILGLTESEFFGLTYNDPNMVWHWLRMHKVVKKDIKKNAPVFEFQAKFYSSDPLNDMKDDVTRYFLCCQVRQDVLSGKLSCSFWSLVVLAAYSIQADFGDSDDFLRLLDEQGKSVYDFFRHYPIAPADQQTPALIDEVCQVHRVLQGLAPSDADIGFLDHATKMALYGMDFHRAQNEDGEPVLLGVNKDGISLYQGSIRLYRYSWSRISKITYFRHSFTIHLMSDQHGSAPRGTVNNDEALSEKHTFDFPAKSHYKLSKRCFKCAVDNHWFFKLHAPDETLISSQKSISNFFRPSLRNLAGYYVGPTQEQLRKRRPESSLSPHSRSQSIRMSSLPGSHADWSSVSNLRSSSMNLKADDSPKPNRKHPAVSLDDMVVSGKGIQPRGVRVGEAVVLLVRRKNGESVDTQPVVSISGPDGENVPLKMQDRKTSFAFGYQPVKPGAHKVRVLLDGQHVSHSPYLVTVKENTPSVVHAFGPGLERAVENEPAIFTVYPNGSTKQIDFEVVGPLESVTNCRSQQRTDGTFDVVYVPPLHGEYAIHVREGGEDVPFSPWLVEAVPQYPLPLEEEAVRASGPGLGQTNLSPNRNASFTIDLLPINNFLLNVTCFDGHSGVHVPIDSKIDSKYPNTRFCSYLPPQQGPYIVYATIADLNIPGSPFHAYVGPPAAPEPMKRLPDPPIPVETAAPKPPPPPPKIVVPPATSTRVTGPMPRLSEHSEDVALDVSQIKASGRGLQPRGVRVQESAVFEVSLNGASGGELNVEISDPSGQPVRCKMVPEMNGDFTCSYKPRKPGVHTIGITYDDNSITDSPFQVVVGGPCKSAIRAFGPGLKEAVANQPAVFTISGNSEDLTQVNISIDGPSKSRITTAQQADGTVDVAFVASRPGEYVLHIDERHEDILHSPFIVQVSPESPSRIEQSADQVVASGPGLSLNTSVQQRSAPFHIDTSNTRVDADPSVSCYNATNGEPMDVQIRRVASSPLFSCAYQPPKDTTGAVVYVKFCGKNVVGSPFHVNVLANDAQKVTASGPGLSSATSGEPTWFAMQYDDSIAPAQISVALTDSKGQVPCSLQVNSDSYSTAATFTPQTAGPLTATVQVGGNHIPGSPFQIEVLPRDQMDSLDEVEEQYGYVSVIGRGIHPNGVRAGEVAEFTVYLPEGDQRPLQVELIDPNGRAAKVDVSRTENEYACAYVPQAAGVYSVNIVSGGQHIDGSPFKVVVEKVVPADVRVFGPGLRDVVTGVPACFTLFPNGVPTEQIAVSVGGPGRSQMQSVMKDDGTVDTTYLPPVDGQYLVSVTANRVDVVNSPWKVTAKSVSPDEIEAAKQVEAAGPGLKRARPGNRVATFSVDTSKASLQLPLAVTAFNAENGSPIDVKVTETTVKKYQCQYVPSQANYVVVYVTFGGASVTGSPFHVPVDERLADSMCAFGPGLLKGLVNQPVKFTLYHGLTSVNDLQALQLAIEGPKAGNQVRLVRQTRTDGTVDVTYWPSVSGDHAIQASAQDSAVPDSPWHALISDKPSFDPNDAANVEASGPGLEARVTNLNAKFVMNTSRAKVKSVPVVTCFEASSGNSVAVECSKLSDDAYSVQYSPLLSGSHVIFVTYNDVDVPNSPFHVNVDCGRSHSYNYFDVSGRGVQTKGIRVGETVDVKIRSDVASELKVSLVGPTPKTAEVPIKRNLQSTECFVSYSVQQPGLYLFNVTHKEQHIPRSPFLVEVKPKTDCAATAFGMGLHDAMVGQPASFRINVDQQSQPIAVKITDPTGAMLPATLKPPAADGSIDASYTPLRQGEHAVHVTSKDEDIARSPWMVDVLPAPPQTIGLPDVTKVLAHGPGINLEVPVNVTSGFDVDTSKATTSTLQSLSVLAMCYDATVGTPVDVRCDGANEKATYRCSYLPTKVHPHLMYISYGHVPLIGSPFSINVVDSKKADEKTDSGIQEIRPINAAANDKSQRKPASAAEIDKANESLSNSLADFLKNTDIPAITSQEDANLPLLTASARKSVDFAARVRKDCCDGGMPVVYGPGLQYGIVNQPARFTIFPNKTPVDHMTVTVAGPSKTQICCSLQSDGTIDASYCPSSPGQYSVHVMVDGQDMVGSPWLAQIAAGTQNIRDSAPLVTAIGRGLRRISKRDNTACFQVDASSATMPAELKVSCYDSQTGAPQQVKLSCRSTGQYDCSYSPDPDPAFSNNLVVYVTFGGVNVASSPYHVAVSDDKTGAGALKAYGPGLVSGVVGQRVKFTVFVGNTRSDQVRVAVENPRCEQVSTDESLQADGTLDVSYVPLVSGQHLISVTQQDDHIAYSPWSALVIPPPATSTSVRLDGPGLGTEVNQGNTWFSADKSSGTAVECYASSGEPVDTKRDDSSGSVKYSYMTKQVGYHVIYVTCDGVNVEKSPFHVCVVDPRAAKIELNGPAISDVLFAGCESSFNWSNSDPKNCRFTILDDKSVEIPYRVANNDPQKIFFVPATVGKLYVKSYYQNQEVSASPRILSVNSFNIRGRGVQPRGIRVGDEVTFKIESELASKLLLRLVGPSPSNNEQNVIRACQKTECAGTFTLQDVGDYTLNVTVDNQRQSQQHVPKSPFKINVGPKVESSSAVYGIGLYYGMVGQPTFACVSPKTSPALPVTVRVLDPTGNELKTTQQSQPDRLELTYVPQKTGQHVVQFLARDDHLPGSPWVYDVQPRPTVLPDVTNVSVDGPAITSPVLVKTTTSFNVDATKSQVRSQLAAYCFDRSTGQRVEVAVHDNGDSTFACSFQPVNAQSHALYLTYGGVNLNSSPHDVTVLDPDQMDRVLEEQKRKQLEIHWASSAVQSVFSDKTRQTPSIDHTESGFTVERDAVLHEELINIDPIKFASVWSHEGESEREEDAEDEKVKGGTKRVRRKTKPLYNIELNGVLNPSPKQVSEDVLTCMASLTQQASQSQEEMREEARSEFGGEIITNTTVQDKHLTSNVSLEVVIPTSIIQAIQLLDSDNIFEGY